MSSNEFDRILKAKFENSELNYNPENWSRLSSELDSTLTKLNPHFKLITSLGLAASILLFIIIILKPYSTNNSNHKADFAFIEKQPANIYHDTKELTTQFQTAEKGATNNKPLQLPKQSYVQHSIVQNIVVDNVFLRKNITTNKVLNWNQTTVKAEKRNNSSFTYTYPYNNRDVTNTELIDIYTIRLTPSTWSFTKRANLNNRFYIEHNSGFNNVAYLNKQQTQVTMMFESTPQPGTIAPAQQGSFTNTTNTTTTTTTTIPLTNSANTFYFQSTPVIGYNLYKEFSFGFGADVQRLIHNENNTETFKSNQFSIFDLGFILKTEINLSKKVSTSLSYRNGLNNILNDRGNVNRNYIQLQLRYKILNPQSAE